MMSDGVEFKVRRADTLLNFQSASAQSQSTLLPPRRHTPLTLARPKVLPRGTLVRLSVL